MARYYSVASFGHVNTFYKPTQLCAQTFVLCKIITNINIKIWEFYVYKGLVLK